jgi:hypothetical protein
MELWSEIRRKVLVEGVSKRQICREYGVGWRTLGKMLAHAEPPGYRRGLPRGRPKLGAFSDWRLIEDYDPGPLPRRQSSLTAVPSLPAGSSTATGAPRSRCCNAGSRASATSPERSTETTAPPPSVRSSASNALPSWPRTASSAADTARAPQRFQPVSGASPATRSCRGAKKIHRAGGALVHRPRELSACAYSPRERLRPTHAPYSVQERN